MDLTTYQQTAVSTAKYPDVGANLVYPALGLAGECGEVVEHIKKAYRVHGRVSCNTAGPGSVTTMSGIYNAPQLALELGDVLWYIAALASEIGYDLSEIAQMNLDKLADRKESGTLTEVSR